MQPSFIQYTRWARWVLTRKGSLNVSKLERSAKITILLRPVVNSPGVCFRKQALLQGSADHCTRGDRFSRRSNTYVMSLACCLSILYRLTGGYRGCRGNHWCNRRNTSSFLMCAHSKMHTQPFSWEGYSRHRASPMSRRLPAVHGHLSNDAVRTCFIGRHSQYLWKAELFHLALVLGNPML